VPAHALQLLACYRDCDAAPDARTAVAAVLRAKLLPREHDDNVTSSGDSGARFLAELSNCTSKHFATSTYALYEGSGASLP
jgi:hypothetical protein